MQPLCGRIARADASPTPTYTMRSDVRTTSAGVAREPAQLIKYLAPRSAGSIRLQSREKKRSLPLQTLLVYQEIRLVSNKVRLVSSKIRLVSSVRGATGCEGRMGK